VLKDNEDEDDQPHGQEEYREANVESHAQVWNIEGLDNVDCRPLWIISYLLYILWCIAPEDD